MRSEAILGLAGVFATGLVLGLAYCAMLWIAVWRVCTGRRSVEWLLAGAVPRVGLPLMGFYWAMDGSWQRLAACLAGFLCARLAVQFRLRDPGRGGASLTGTGAG